MSKIESVRKAQRRGWHVVDTTTCNFKSFNDIVKWCESHINGYYVYSFTLGKFAFEQGKDATWFTLKWM